MSVNQVKEKSEKKEHQRVRGMETNAPPEDFRDLDVFPTKKDILETKKPYLRKNIIKGPYQDANHYLDVHFRLLREDYIHSLRNGIKSYKEEFSAHGRRGKKSDIRTYSRITIMPPVVDKKTGKITSEVICEDESFKRIRWIVSKKLLYGSLVCFSSDMFQDNLIFATVADRNVEQLMKGKLEVSFERPEAVNYHKQYIMVESEAYFEAYRHTLEGLKGPSFNMLQNDQYFQNSIGQG